MVTAMKPKLDRFRFNVDSPIKTAMKIDITTMNALIGYCFKKSVLINRRSLSNLRKFFNMLDDSLYSTDDRLQARFEFIKLALEARIDKGLESEALIMEHCKSDSEDAYNSEIISKLPHYTKISHDDIKYLNNWISERLKYIWIEETKERYFDIVSRMEGGDYKSYAAISNELIELCKEVINIDRKASNIAEEQSIGIGDIDFLDKVEGIIEALRDPNNTLQTGIQALNQMLIGGYMSSRLYMYCGLPGGYKSFMLLKAAVDIKKYNKTLPKKIGARKTVLIVTMENTVQESIARMFNMTITSEPLKDFNPKKALEMIKKEGAFKIEGEGDTDIIIKYFPINEISTDDLYTIIEELKDENREVIALVLDYIKRIRPSQYAKEEKEQLKNVTNELKNIAVHFDIPVISAH